MEAQWSLVKNSVDDVGKIQQALGVHPVTAQLLVARGLTTPDAAKSFLYPSLEDMHSPFCLAHMETAVERIAAAMRDEQRIVVFGDYDVDGVTSASMLLGYFGLLRYKADYYVPSRSEEGYGLNLDAVRNIAARGCDLLITVDCGIQRHCRDRTGALAGDGRYRGRSPRVPRTTAARGCDTQPKSRGVFVSVPRSGCGRRYVQTGRRADTADISADARRGRARRLHCARRWDWRRWAALPMWCRCAARIA